MSLALPPRGPMLAVLGVGLLLLLMQRRGAAVASSPLGTARSLYLPGRTNNTAAAATPQNVANALARRVVQQVFGIATRAPDTGVGIGSADARAAIRAAEDPGYYGWTGPVIGAVENTQAAIYTGADSVDQVDAIPGAPVYDITSDYQNNPWIFSAP